MQIDIGGATVGENTAEPCERCGTLVTPFNIYDAMRELGLPVTVAGERVWMEVRQVNESLLSLRDHTPERCSIARAGGQAPPDVEEDD